MTNHRIQYLFQKHISDSSTPEELDELLDLLDGTENEAIEESLRQLWEEKRGYKVPSERVDWVAMEERIQQFTQSTTSLARQQRYWQRYAAAAVLLLSLSLGGYLWYHSDMREPELMVESIVPIIQRDTIILSDGSRVILNAGSTLRYPEAFTGNDRQVYLEGEGYFEVAKNPNKPFIVHAGQLKTKVLGTSFNINAYTGQSKMEVSVLTGRVQVEEIKSGRHVDLLPNEKVRYVTQKDQFIKISIADIKNDLAWNTGRLAFDDAPLTDIVQQYYRRYGKKIEIEGEGLTSCRLSLVFDEESPEEILKMIALLSNSKVKENGGTVILYGRGCAISE